MFSVLYVDDEPGLLEIGKVYLENFGDFAVTTVLSAAEGLSQLKTAHFDAIISDYHMPEMDGLEFLKRVRAGHGSIPFILFTGRGREEVVIVALNLGADFYIQKGGDPQAQFAELAHKLRQAVQRRRMETALEESESRYRAVIESQTELICRFRPDGTLLFVNGAFCTYYGKTADELVGRPFRRGMPVEEREIVARHLASLTHENPVGTTEHTVLMPDGSTRWQQWTDRAIFDENGAVAEFQSVGRDITDRKQAQEALEQSENLYRTVFDTTGAATIIIAPDTTILLANAGWEKLTGMPRADQEGKISWTRFFGSDDADRMVRYHHDRRKDPALAPDVYESRLIDTAGTIHHCYVHVHMIPGTKNSVASLVDITEHRKGEEELKESEEKFRALAGHIPVAIGVIQDNRYVYMNRHLVHAMGYSPEELASMDYWVHVREDQQAKIIADGEAWARGEPGPWMNELEYFTKSGERRWAFSTAAHIMYHGRHAGIVALVGITERREAEEDLQAANRQLAAVNHELQARNAELEESRCRIAESEAEYRSIITTMEDAFYRTDGAGILTLVSPSFPAMLGYAGEEEVLGRNLKDFYCRPEDREAALAELDRSGRVRMYRADLRRKDGSIVVVSASSHILRDRSGRPAGVEGLLRNVTGAVAAEEALKESQAKLELALEGSRLGMWEVEFPSGKGSGDERCSAIFGYGNEETRPEPLDWEALTHPDDLPLVRKKLADHLAGRTPMYESEHRMRHRSGSWIWITGRGRLTPPLPDGSRRILGTMLDITARKEAEEALRVSEEKYRLLADHVHDVIWTADMDMRLTYISPSVTRLRGFTPDEALREPLSAALTPASYRTIMEKREEARAQLMAGTPGPAFQSMELEFLKKDGSTVWTETILSPLFDRDHRVRGVVGVIREITDRKNADEALRLINQQLADAMEMAGLITWEYDPVTGMLLFNDRFYALLGTTAEREGGYRMPAAAAAEAFVHPGDRGAMMAGLESLRNAPGPVLIPREARLIRKDGTILSVAGRIRVRRPENGGAVTILGTMLDVTPFRDLARDLGESEDRFRLLVENLPDTVAILDRAMRVRYANPAAFRLIGLDPGDPQDFPELARFLPPEFLRKAEDRMEQIRTAGILTGEYRIVTVTGEDRWVESFSISDVPWQGERLILVCNRDITERRKAEEILRQVNRKLNLLSGITRHDIANQILVLKGFLKILEQREQDETLAGFCRKAAASADRIASMIRFTREYESLGSAAPVWQEIRALVDAEAGQALPAGITLENAIPAGLEVLADPMVAKVIHNLMGNTLLHGGNVTAIRASASDRGDTKVIAWEDNGAGVPADDKERIFDRGFGKNTGLGLSLSREILAITGLTIRETGTPGEGARFEIAVPRGAWRTPGT